MCSCVADSYSACEEILLVSIFKNAHQWSQLYVFIAYEIKGLWGNSFSSRNRSRVVFVTALKAPWWCRMLRFG
jgi:hypothetical protein